MLTLIRAKTNDKPNYTELYQNAFFRTIKYLVAHQDDRQKLKQAIYYGIKYINSMQDTKPKDLVIPRMQLIYSIEKFIEQITPAEFMEIFPIQKTYDGEKYQCKDYFYTVNEINKLEINEPIGDKAISLFWDYVNNEISLFLVALLGNADDVLKLEGKKGIWEQWCDDNDITTYTQYEDSAGCSFLQNNTTGETVKVKRKIPRYMKVATN